jgi:hypothetical protein
VGECRKHEHGICEIKKRGLKSDADFFYTALQVRLISLFGNSHYVFLIIKPSNQVHFISLHNHDWKLEQRSLAQKFCPHGGVKKY